MRPGEEKSTLITLQVPWGSISSSLSGSWLYTFTFRVHPILITALSHLAVVHARPITNHPLHLPLFQYPPPLQTSIVTILL